jgi:hypothetical protein
MWNRLHGAYTMEWLGELAFQLIVLDLPEFALTAIGHINAPTVSIDFTIFVIK